MSACCQDVTVPGDAGQPAAAQPATATGARPAYGALRPRSAGGNQYTAVLRSAMLPRSLGWGTPQRRVDAKPSTSAGRPPRPRTGPAAAATTSTSSSTSILKRCKRALARASGRRSKHGSAEVAQHGDSASRPMSLVSSTYDASAAITPVSQADYDSDAEVHMLPPMDPMLEDSAEDVVPAVHAASTPGSGRRSRWLPWRWKR